MTSVLGGNASALLFERIREELGLCYGIYARTYRFEGFNFIEISTGCAAKDLDTVHQEVLQIIDRLQNELISEERLQMVKASMLSSLYMGIESSAGINSFLAQCYLRGDRGDILENRVNAIKAVDPQTIQNLAQSSFQCAPLRAELVPAK
jgi:predicted Zn-dependent peptidase